jgi:hypothetical protein
MIMEIKITHCLLVNADVEEVGITKIRTYESKFPRELGDRIIDEGSYFKIGAISPSKETIIQKGNELISIQKKLNKQRKRHLEAQFDSAWLTKEEIEKLLKF